MTMQVLPYVFQEQLVRARLDEQGNPWFVAKDVCAVLDIQDHHQAIEQLDDDERGRCTVPTPGGMQELKVISESPPFRACWTMPPTANGSKSEPWECERTS